MVFYLIPYIFGFASFAVVINRKDNKSARVILFLLLIPSIIIAVFRGNVGTDTSTYVYYFDSLIRGEDPDQFEMGFKYFSNFLVSLGLNARQCVGIVSALTSVLIVIFYGSSKKYIAIFFLGIFPVFYYDMTMNGIRYGLSFAISNFAVSYLIKRHYVLFVLLTVVAASIQISSLLISLIFLVSIFDLKKILIASILFILIAGTALNFDYFNLSYLYEKQDFYKDVFSPNPTSGYSTLLLFMALFFQLHFFVEKKMMVHFKVIYLILILELISFLISKYSYSGLRFQSLFLYALFLVAILSVDKIRNFKLFLIITFIVGSIGFVSKTRHFYHKDDNVSSPFLPYRFYWQEYK